MEYFTPSEVIEGICGMESEGEPKSDIVLTIISNFEGQAKAVLTKNGYGPDFKTNYYVPKKGLTIQEQKAEERLWRYYKWINEATQLVGHGDYVIEQAANTILEAGSLRHFVESGQTEKVAVSMAFLVATGLLQSDQIKEADVTAWRNRYKTIEPDAELGKSTRENLIRFAITRGSQQTKDRESEWQGWQKCADEIRAENKHIKSKNDLAKKVKTRLNLPDSVETIRKRIN